MERRGFFATVAAGLAAMFFPAPKTPADVIPPDFLDYGEGLNEEESSTSYVSSCSMSAPRLITDEYGNLRRLECCGKMPDGFRFMKQGEYVIADGVWHSWPSGICFDERIPLCR